MNYDERLERLEAMNGQAVDLLKTLLDIESIQTTSLNRHEILLTRIETNLAEATDKLNLMIAREMKSEGGPEAQI